MEVSDKNSGELFEGNLPFFQFRKHNFKLIRKLNQKSPLAANLFFFLVENMNGNTNSLIVSQDTLCDMLECGRTSIYNAIKVLTEGLYIQVLKSGTSNIYCVNADIVWTKRADAVYFAHFNASVYVTSNEQDEEQKVKIKKRFEKIVSTEKQDKVQKDKEPSAV